jgi:hypothetical protein
VLKSIVPEDVPPPIIKRKIRYAPQIGTNIKNSLLSILSTDPSLEKEALDYYIDRYPGISKQIINKRLISKHKHIETNIQRISSGGSELPLAQPLRIAIDFRDGNWIMENQELGIISISADYDQCLEDFNSEFLFLSREYGGADDSSLTLDAKALKSKVLEYIQPQNDPM